MIALVGLVGLTWLVLVGHQQSRSENARRLTELSRHLGQMVVVVTDTGGNVRWEQPVPGQLIEVNTEGVTVLDAEGRQRFVPLAGVRALERTGRRIGEWR